MLLLRWYAIFKAKLLKTEVIEAEIKKATIAGVVNVAFYVVAVIMCFFNTTTAIGIYVLIPFLYLFTQRKTKN